MGDHDHDGEIAVYGSCLTCDAADRPPPTDGPSCLFCGDAVDPNARTTYREVVGWTRPRTAGGTNAIRLRRELHRFACSACVSTRSSGTPETLPLIKG